MEILHHNNYSVFHNYVSGVSFEIVDSSFPGQGRLQLTFEGVSGSIGTEEWSDNDAHIACRQMGFASGVTSDPTKVVTPYYLNKLICYSESIKSILQCGNTGWGVNSTGVTDSASVRCYTHGKRYLPFLVLAYH